MYLNMVQSKQVTNDDLTCDAIAAEFSEMFKSKPELFEDRIDEFAEVMTTREEWIKMTTLGFFYEVAKTHPQVK